mmetsp:Transcript_31029/g.49851  ORF Transcript_31029/g.49851 Transcript_31029/m.49851 type:complete len:220 (+) Transcript_31029:185-844(+)
MRAPRRRQVELGVVWVVSVVHPDPVWVPWERILGNPGSTALRAATVEVASHWVRVLDALTLAVGLHPLDGVALGPDADTPCILEDDHHDQRPHDEDGRHHPHWVALEPGPVGRVVLGEVAVVDSVEHAGWHQSPVLPLVAVVPDWLVQRVLLGSAIRLELRRRRRRRVQEGRRTAQADQGGSNTPGPGRPDRAKAGRHRTLACGTQQGHGFAEVAACRQ